MKNVATTLFIAVLILLVLPRWGESCLPDFPEIVFTRPSGPDRPLAKFAKGQIGIPLPTWRRAFLVVAYRYLDDKPLNPSEQHSLLTFFDTYGVRDRDVPDLAIDSWLSERAKVRGGAQPKISLYRDGESPYYKYTNCLPPAFHNAVLVLHARTGQFGAKSAELQEWIRAQDTVFENCSGGSSVPGPSPATANSLMRADRAYQIAAAHFYAMQLPEALRDFDGIARDNSSPWSSLASYMAVRTIIRQAWSETKAGTNEEYNPTILAQAEPRLAAISSNVKLRSLRKDAERLQSLVRFHLHPDRRQHELALTLLSGRSGLDFGQQLLDYKLLLDRFLDVEPQFDDGPSWGPVYDRRVKEWKRKLYPKLKTQRSDELSDWLMTLQSDAEEAKLHAVSRWKSTGSVPWLFVAMLKLDGKDKAVSDVLRAASEIPEMSPAYVAISFHRSRLLRESGQTEAAHQVIESVIRRTDTLPVSALNLLRDEQMRNSADFATLRDLLVREPVEVTAEESDVTGEDSLCYRNPKCNLAFYGVPDPTPNSPLLPQFDLSVAETLNKRLPVDLVVEAALSESLPANLRARLAVSAWARAALLGNPAAAQRVAESAATARPEMKPFIDGYAAALTEDERHFAATFAVLHFAGLRPFVDSSYPRTTEFKKIDDYRDNWWCGDVGGIPEELSFFKQENDNLRVVGELDHRFEATSPIFLSSEQQAQASAEWKQLLSMGLASEYLPRQVLDWAGKYPSDPRVPEALHLAWRADRYGCADNRQNVAESHLSHDIFKLMHKHYPNSEWTKKTPVW